MQQAGQRSQLHVAAIRHLVQRGLAPPGGPADIAALVLDSFAYTARYIDDMYSLANPIRSELTYVAQSWQGVRGIYPTELNLAVAGSGAQLVYMDLKIRIEIKFVGAQALADFATELYCKHVDGPFSHLRLVRYPHITSLLSWECKYNILITEFHRIIRRVTRQEAIWSNLARIVCDLCAKGYRIGMLMELLSGLLHQHGVLRFAGEPRIYLQFIAQLLFQMLRQRGMPEGFVAWLLANGYLAMCRAPAEIAERSSVLVARSHCPSAWVQFPLLAIFTKRVQRPAGRSLLGARVRIPLLTKSDFSVGPIPT